ncbi:MULTISPECIES: DUF952 domain-containing protein [unclassified Ornithinimicrobium]|uniref:DUF952 domain-containing protein n=1 Tax=unclassified Ornithinimicrobium TaxID=2615080 RepID=UPI003852B984
MSVGRPFWHLAERAHWEAALRTGRYDRSTRGATLAEVGFVHCSYPEQLPGVVKAFHARATEELVVLELDPQRLVDLGVEVRDEPGDPQDPGSPLFPHVFGPLPVTAVVRTRPAAVDRGWLDLGPWQDLDCTGLGSSGPALVD